MSPSTSAPTRKAQLAFDVGGTFTDLLVFDGTSLHALKVFTCSEEPARPVKEALAAEVLPAPSRVLHGTTLATNTLLERKGARVVLLTTRGFEDVLEIARQARPSLYDIQVDRPPPLVPRSLRIGIRERTLPDGSIQAPVDPEELRGVLRLARLRGSQAAAVCFLHSPTNPENEERVGALLEGTDLPFSLSHRVAPIQGEYERTAVTVANAHLLPRMGRYLGRLSTYWPGVPVRIMQSNGGLLSSRTASELPVQTVLSGPAAGVIGAFRVAKAAGIHRIISFDMGGTSTDVCLCDAGIPWTEETQVGDLPIPVPMTDIVTVGSGGGSIVHVDAGGALRVGPESAGSMPGPICYGRGGTRPALTDAHVLLGRLPADAFLGGTHTLEIRGLRDAFLDLGGPVGLSYTDTARGAVRIANTLMEGALRSVSVERGFDPRDFTLVTFGGAGGLHACELAGRLGIREVLVPPNPGLLSAYGLLLADVVRDRSTSVLKIAGDEIGHREILRLARDLRQGLVEELKRVEGVPAASIRVEAFAVLRYTGQATGMPIAVGTRLIERFHEAHRRRYGFHREGYPVELVRVQVRAVGRGRRNGAALPGLGTPPPGEKTRACRSPGRRSTHERAALHIDGRTVRADVVPRSALRPGHRRAGPLVVTEYSSTLLVSPAFSLEVDRDWNLRLTRKGGRR